MASRPIARLSAPGTTALTGPSPGSGYPWHDGEFLYAQDLNDAIGWAAGISDINVVDVGSSNAGRNYVHNSLFNIRQRGNGPFPITNATLTADRWKINFVNDAMNTTMSALSDTFRAQIGDESAVWAFQNSFTGTAGAGLNYLSQAIEGVRRLAGKTVTVSFYADCAPAMKLGVNLIQNFGTGGSPTAPSWISPTGQSVTMSATWTRFSLTFAIPSVSGRTLGTDGNDHTALSFFYSSGATNNAVAGNIGVQSGTVNLWGVQLEIGPTATPLEKPDPQVDLAKCQRFYQVGYLQFTSYQAAGFGFVVTAPLQVTLRAAPAVSAVTLSATGLINLPSIVVNLVLPYAITLTGSATATAATSIATGFSISADL